MKLNFSFDIAIIISIVAVFLFANGQAYLGSYLDVFGIDVTTLNLSIQDKLYYGYIIKGVSYLLYSIFLIIGYIIATYAIKYTNCFNKLGVYLENKISKNSNKMPLIHNSRYYDEIEQNYKDHSFAAVLIMIILISTLFLLANTQKNAKDAAYNDIKKFDFRQVQLKNKSNKPDVFLIKCGTTLCALIDKNKNVTLEDPKNIIFFVKKEQK
ncbi:hypothetical protein E0H86_05870 [Acinetobacter sp. ANC 4635]|uniref:hypothetical protein n=1 Tax=Acinetobacter sp. ANC 4635 TaxID=2529846 RepID=UPI00103C9045|nr:hypothetical protein [Acinetobacter sp. ANC 4635]TCB31947.1 hypothetical protein E0H86_05870 [Acinetobacter sp. ANC 4635]